MWHGTSDIKKKKKNVITILNKNPFPSGIVLEIGFKL